MQSISKNPALQLYRNILREHRRLPMQHRELGNKYVKNEFIQHKNAKDLHLQQFMREWTLYLGQLKRQRDSFGIAMSDNQLASLSKEQVAKLKESLSS